MLEVNGLYILTGMLMDRWRSERWNTGLLETLETWRRHWENHTQETGDGTLENDAGVESGERSLEKSGRCTEGKYSPLHSNKWDWAINRSEEWVFIEAMVMMGMCRCV